MNKTLRISFALKNTYRVNSILYSLKQIPLIKKLLPESLYKVQGLKILANVISVLWEIIAMFLGKFIYLIIMVVAVGNVYKSAGSEQVFLHILLFLTAIGAFTNTNMFNPSRDKYYAMILMRMDARDYTLINYGYAILKIIVGFMPFAIILGRGQGLPLWICLLVPFFVAGAKVLVAASSLWDYDRKGLAYNENKLGKFYWIAVGLLLAAAYLLPVRGIVVPKAAVVVLMIVTILGGIISARKIITFAQYRSLYQELLANFMNPMEVKKDAVKLQNQKAISADTGISSHRKGFEYLNELFIKRHQKILWKSTKKITAVCLFLVLGLLLLFYMNPQIKDRLNELLLIFLPYFVFIMYAINRGTGFTSALFMNCDHSLLTYSFYKQPDMVLKLFGIRLREIVKINLPPAVMIGAGLALMLYVSGGTDNPVNYAVLIISVICMSIFFSVHYLTIYYLLQPYNAGTEIKSGTYKMICSATYLVCFFMMQLRMPTLVFGLLCIAFCVIYCVVACVLVYRFAPKTFRLRT